MAESVDPDVSELQALRQEITSHLTISSTLVAVELAALGAGFSVVDRSEHILAGLAGISSLLWLLWVDHSTQILKIASYIAVELGPRMSGHLGRPVLGWEVFLRRINLGGKESAAALYGVSSPPTRNAVVRPLRNESYTSLLFGAAPPLLLAVYLAASLRTNNATILMWSACAAGGFLWFFAISRFVDFVHNAKVMDRAILAHTSHLRSRQL